MAGSNLSPLGYLIKLLGISISELSLAINIERSSISKWKNGTRHFGIDSTHYAQVADYIASKNKEMGVGLLEDFFADIFSDENNDSPNYVKDCIRRFILNKDILDKNGDLICYSKNGLYNAKHSVYTGVEGRKDAFAIFLNTAESLTKPHKIYILDDEHFKWLHNDSQYMKMFSEKLKNILDKGHKVEVIQLITDDMLSHPWLHDLIMPLAFHENLTNYIVPPKANKAIGINMYIIQDLLLVTGLKCDKKSVNMYSCIYRDKLSISAYLSIIYRIRSDLSPMLITDKKSIRPKILTTIRNSTDRKEPIYFTGKSLSISTMSEDLLNEVLQQNMLTKKEAIQCYEFYNALRSNIEAAPQSFASGYYIFIDDIISSLGFKNTINTSLTAILNKPVTMSRKQYYQHILDTTNILLKDNRYRIMLNHGHNPSNMIIWLKQNLWCIAIKTSEAANDGSKFMFSDDISILSVFKNGFEEGGYNIRSNYKDNDFVSNILMKIYSGEYRPI